MPESTGRGELTRREDALREDLSREYYALVDTVSGYDGRLMIVKGWSVTLSLAALGLGFQQQHYALFALGAATALAFWFLDAMMKGHQVRSYSRMRDIEVAAYALNAVELRGLGRMSAPRIDMSWGYRGQDPDWRAEAPQRRTPEQIRSVLTLRWVMPHVFLPHLVAVLLGVALFCAAAADWSWLAALEP
jgi:hypothetical protein